MLKQIATVLAIVLCASGALAQDSSAEAVQRLEKRIQELEAQVKKLTDAKPAAAEAAGAKPEAPATATAPAPAEGTAAPAPANGNGNGNGKWFWGAYLDAYYGYNFNRPASRVNQLRNFDVNSNQFSLNYAELTLEHPAEPLGFRLDLGFGDTARIVHSFEPAGTDLFRHLQQAYVSYKAPVGNGLTLDFGKFVTQLGAEVIETRDNFNYSRSLLFAYAIPYYHFGLRATYPVSNQVSIGGQIVNGWNNVADNNTGKSYVGTFNWTPNRHFTLIQNFITGPERTDDNRGYRSVWDTVVTVTPSDKLVLQANYDYGMDRPDGFQRAHWTGISGAARFTVSPRFAIAPRIEWFNDVDGFATGMVQRLKEATLTFDFKLREGLISRLEYRRDWSNQPFFDRRGLPGIGREQNTILGGLMYSFSSPR